MNFLPIYRISFYAALFLATLILCVESADESMVSRILPLAVAVVGVLAFFSVDRDPRYGLSLGAATLFSWMAIFLCYLEYRDDESQLIPPLSHWLTYLQMIKMFRNKTNEDEWYLLLIALVQVMVGAVLTTGGDTIGPLILLWAILAVWTMALFYLNRASQRGDSLMLAMLKSSGQSLKSSSKKLATNANSSRKAAKGDVVTGSQINSSRARTKTKPQGRVRYVGLMDKAFVMATLRIAVTSLVLGCAVFLLAPRFSSNSVPGPLGSAQNMTGFDGDNIRLGRLGEILESDLLVMYVKLTDDETERSLDPMDIPYEPLWRGTCLTLYSNETWRRGEQKSISLASDLLGRWEKTPVERRPKKRIRQTFTLEPTRSVVRFGLRPILYVPEASSSLSMHRFDGTISSQEGGSELNYVVVSAYDSTLRQPLEDRFWPTVDSRNDPNNNALKIDDPQLKSQLNKIALDVVGSIPAEDDLARGRALEKWLRDSGEFGYSLMMTRTDPSLDPVEDFLVNHRQGHCEYFASALALLLRSIDIPSRVVNGFKGGDWDGVNKVMNIRQKHAHSWVEAYASSPSGNGQWTWVTMDPTPSGPRNASVAKVGNVWPGFRQINDAVRYVWVFYVQGFNADRQKRLIYEPLQRLIRNARDGFAIMGGKIKQIFTFKDWRSIFSFDGFVASFLLLLGIVLVVQFIRWIWKKLIRRLLPSGRFKRAGDGLEVEFYLRLVRLLREQGLDRLESETPLEFARRAGTLLTTRIRDDRALSESPALVAEAFYLVRFGDRQLSTETLDELNGRLNALETALRAA